MASVFELNFDTKKGVAESTLMLATKAGGHFYNMISDKDIENGSVVRVPKGKERKEQDVFTAVAPAKGDKVCLVLTAPKIYEDHMKQCQDECYFFNKAGEIMRAYEIYDTDRFTLSKEAFADNAVVEVGKYVVVDAGKHKLTTQATEGTGNGFVGYIYEQAPNGNYRVYVEQNRTVSA